MSMLIDWLRDLGELFFPARCEVCGGALPSGVRLLCSTCRIRAPRTGYIHAPDNPLIRSFDGQLPVVQASALLFFEGGTGWQALIHRFKYRGHWRLAREMGRWYGEELNLSESFQRPDVVLPVPLHWRKRMGRGYNQSEYLAEGLARELNIPLDCRSVVRLRNNPSQARRSREERWSNVENLFGVRYPERLRGKHILLVDDVVTTRATLISCGEAILQAVPDVRISIAVLATSKHQPHGY